MSGTAGTAPRGGIARVSRRVMNLAYILTQNARRHGDRPGFIWNEKAWSWRHIDQNVSALAAALAARGIGKGDLRHGADGKDLIVPVPDGTVVKTQSGEVLADLVEETRVPAWLSVTLADGGPTGVPRLPDGTPLTALAEVAAAHPTVRAVGVNCVRPDQVSPALEALAAVSELPLIAYPNSGETYDAESMTWQDPTAEAGERLGAWPVADWIARGARIVGGCCRTTPADIAELVLRASSRG